jgi:uncharacterized hydrophobic protein (TIGR00271 family)
LARKNYFGRFLGQELSADQRREVLEDLFIFGKANRNPFLIRMAVLLTISTVIATCGLLANSAAVVIGAMLVAPMMRPVMAAAAAITLGWSGRLYRSLFGALVMGVSAVAIAAGIAYLSPDFVTVPDEVLGRTRPTFFDLVIALAAGSGGAYTMTRKESNAIPGVAMAVALLPPLSAAGILIVFGEADLALRAFVLFIINFLAMILAGSLTFLATGVSPASTRSRFSKFIRYQLFGFLLLVIGISIPLSYYSEDVWYDAEYRAAKSEDLQLWLKRNQLELTGADIDMLKEVVTLEVAGPNPPLTIEGLYGMLRERAMKNGNEREFRLDVIWTEQARFSWPPPEMEEAALAEVEVPLPTPGEMLGVSWEWRGTQYSNGRWVGLEKKGRYNFVLARDVDGGVAVQISCNRGRGGYQLQDFTLNLKVLTTTRAMCPEPEVDNVFVADLNRVASYRIKDGKLILHLNSNAGVMHFEASAP